MKVAFTRSENLVILNAVDYYFSLLTGFSGDAFSFSDNLYLPSTELTYGESEELHDSIMEKIQGNEIVRLTDDEFYFVEDALTAYRSYGYSLRAATKSNTKAHKEVVRALPIIARTLSKIRSFYE